MGADSLCQKSPNFPEFLSMKVRKLKQFIASTLHTSDHLRYSYRTCLRQIFQFGQHESFIFRSKKYFLMAPKQPGEGDHPVPTALSMRALICNSINDALLLVTRFARN